MLISPQELRFDFKGATFDLKAPADRSLLAWIFSQFLYGEVTGIQCGHWLYHAPHLSAATFLAKQASEELSHVRKFLRIFSLMGEKPEPAHRAVKFLSSGMMGVSWGEHVALEMALGEGLVLGVFYAMVDTIQDPEIHKLLDSSAIEEERHVLFGEKETQDWLKAHPESRKILLGLAVIQSVALRRLKSFVLRKLGQAMPDHPVLKQFPAFYDHSVRCFELRVERLGLATKPLSEMGAGEKLGLVVCLPVRKLWARLFSRRPLLTSTYLGDPSLKEELAKFRPS
jgi:hypothetical protein